MQKLPGWLVWVAALAVWFTTIGALTFAQAPVLPTSYIVRFFLTDTSIDVIASSALPSTAYSCNIDPATPFQSGRVTARWDDPSNAGRQCRYVDPGNGAFVQPPPNQQVYVAIAGCINGTECSANSNRVTYRRTQLPGVPTNFGVNVPPATIALGRVDQRYRVGSVDVASGPTNLGVRLLFGVDGTLPIAVGQQFAVAAWP